jgi:hypothetical protein
MFFQREIPGLERVCINFSLWICHELELELHPDWSKNTPMLGHAKSLISIPLQRPVAVQIDSSGGVPLGDPFWSRNHSITNSILLGFLCWRWSTYRLCTISENCNLDILEASLLPLPSPSQKSEPPPSSPAPRVHPSKSFQTWWERRFMFCCNDWWFFFLRTITFYDDGM